MAELSNLTNRILEEAKSLADEIVKSAELKAENIMKKSNEQAKLRYDSIVEKGTLEAENLKERLKSNAKLKARDNELNAKQEVIKRVFEEALEDVKNIDDEKLISYIQNNASFSEDSILLVQKDRLDLIKEKFPQSKVSEERFVDSGFVEISGGIEKNFTFSTQIDYIKDEIQGEIAKVLFR
ncbi:ATP synthase subunit E [Peptostreptococcus russellii]|uniref:ATP synthase subunit E n=1 Tax=Peptostreptococcus russellii TaxID=215200 RepID=A0A2P7PZG3_9FIRM|nr:V-type ATP synthase subunit E [Peptostreptococcus russellii]PSJ31104.1 ATP synthase subunit E [Peptostreptococcus russellii]